MICFSSCIWGFLSANFCLIVQDVRYLTVLSIHVLTIWPLRSKLGLWRFKHEFHWLCIWYSNCELNHIISWNLFAFLLFSNGVWFYLLFLVFPFMGCLSIVLWFLDFFAFLIHFLCMGLCFFNILLSYLSKKKFLESFSLATFCQYVNLLMKIAWDFQICYFITEDVLFTFHIFSCLILIFEQYAIKWLVNSIDYWMPMLGLFSTTETYIWCTCFTCFVG